MKIGVATVAFEEGKLDLYHHDTSKPAPLSPFLPPSYPLYSSDQTTAKYFLILVHIQEKDDILPPLLDYGPTY